MSKICYMLTILLFFGNLDLKELISGLQHIIFFAMSKEPTIHSGGKFQ